jgi:hypothetical protein
MFSGNFAGVYHANSSDQLPVLDIRMQPTLTIPNVAVLGIEGSQNAFSAAREWSGTGSLTGVSIGYPDQLQTHYAMKTVLLDDDVSASFLPNTAIVVAPFTATKNHDPERMWSIARTDDPLHGPFHTYLATYGINNTDSDYGEGLVFTWGKDQLTIPLSVNQESGYEVYVRYFANQEGGKMRISLQDFDRTLDTFDYANRFRWASLGQIDLAVGRQTVTLYNELGFNAVNMITFVPLI